MVARIENYVSGRFGGLVKDREMVEFRKQDMGEWEVEKARFYHQSSQAPAKSCFYDQTRTYRAGQPLRIIAYPSGDRA